MTGLTLGFTSADVMTNMQPLLTTIGPILAFVVAIPITFYLARKVKGLFASSR